MTTYQGQPMLSTTYMLFVDNKSIVCYIKKPTSLISCNSQIDLINFFSTLG